MSSQSGSSRTAATAQSEAISPGVQLTKLLIKFGETAAELAAQKKMIEELVNSGVQPEPIPIRQPESPLPVMPPAQAILEGSFIPIPPSLLYTDPYTSYPHPTYNPNYPQFYPTYTDPITTLVRISQPNFHQGQPCLNHRPPPPNKTTFSYNRSQPTQAYHRGRARTYTNLARPLDQVYEHLKAVGRIDTLPPITYIHGRPASYNPRAVCAYHSGAPGHSTAECRALKCKVQDMIDAGELVVRERPA